MDLQDGREDERVGSDNGQSTYGQDSSGHNEIQQCVNPSVSTHQEDKRRHATVEMVNDVGATKEQLKDSCYLSHGVQEASHIGSKQHLNTESLGHGDGVQERVRDGHVAIIGHGH